MNVLVGRNTLLAALGASSLLAGSAGGASAVPPNTQAAAEAYAIRITVPGQPVADTAAAVAPPDAVAG